MSRKGLWSCEACAREHGLPWGEQAGAEKGWCGMTQHRAQTRLEWMPDVEPALHILDYVFPDRAHTVPAAPTPTHTFTPSVKPAPATAAPSVQPQQLELL